MVNTLFVIHRKSGIGLYSLTPMFIDFLKSKVTVIQITFSMKNNVYFRLWLSAIYT